MPAPGSETIDEHTESEDATVPPEQEIVPPEAGSSEPGEGETGASTDDATVAAGDESTGEGPPEPPVDPEVAERRHRRRRRLVIAAPIVLLIVAAIVVVNVVHVDKYVLAPGSVRRTEELVTINGQPTFRDDAGNISYTTVSFTQASLWNAWFAERSDGVELVSEESLLHGQDPDENRKENLQAMDDSKGAATYAALAKLGYKVSVKGSGAVITALSDGSPSNGILEAGDAIVSLDGKPITTKEELIDALKDRKPGEEIALVVEPDRSGKRVDKRVTLAARPDDANRGFMGVVLATRDKSYSLPFTVSIDSGQVGGPSAGLAFTLGVIDVLTPGSLTGGTKVATTGTMQDDGVVGPVGGVKQKTYAVRAAGATLFLVPPQEYDEAVQYAGPDLKVVKVETLDQALDVIAQNGGNTGPVAEKAAANAAANKTGN